MNIPYTAIEINLQAERLRVLRSNILQVTRMYNKVCHVHEAPADFHFRMTSQPSISIAKQVMLSCVFQALKNHIAFLCFGGGYFD